MAKKEKEIENLNTDYLLIVDAVSKSVEIEGLYSSKATIKVKAYSLLEKSWVFEFFSGPSSPAAGVSPDNASQKALDKLLPEFKAELKNKIKELK